MENSFSVGVFDSARHLCHHLHAFSRLVAKGRCPVTQASTHREFHAEKRETVLAFAHLVDRKNVRMIKAGYRFSFAAETYERFMRISLIT